MLHEKTGVNKIVVLFACVMLLQCLSLLYWQTQRGNLSIDELHSFESASSYLVEARCYLPDAPMWEYGRWMETENLIDHFKVDNNESLLTLPLGARISRLAHKRTYNGLLNLIMTDAGHEADFYEYAWRALILNILLFLIAELLIANIVKEITGSDEIMIMSATMFGFSGIVMCLCEYVRFYMLTILLLLSFLYCHLKIWKENRFFHLLIWELSALCFAYFGLLHSELILVTCGSFFCVFFVGLLFQRRFKHAVIYSAPLILGLYSYMLKSHIFRVVLHPSEFADPTGHGAATATYNLLTCTPERMWECLKRIIAVFSEKWFGNSAVMLALLTLLTICIVKQSKEGKKSQTEKCDENYACVAGFVFVLLITSLISIIFNLLTNLSTDRYNSYIIVLLMIVFWFAIARMQDVFDRRAYLSLVAMLIISGAIISQRADIFSYLYIDEQPLKYMYEEYCDTDSIMFTGGYLNPPYDGVFHAGRNAKVLAVEVGHEKELKKIKDLPDEFIAICDIGGGNEPLMQALVGTDYKPSFLGKTWQNEMYLCVKR